MTRRGKRCLPSRGPKLLTRASAVLLSCCLLFSLCPMAPLAQAEDTAGGPLFPQDLGGAVELVSEKLYLDQEGAFDYTKPTHPERELTAGCEVSKDQVFTYYAVYTIPDFAHLEGAATDDTYSLSAPSGLSWPTGAESSTVFTVSDGSVSYPFATLTAGGGKAALDFEWNEAFADLENGRMDIVIKGCVFDVPTGGGGDETYTVVLGSTTFTLTITENQPVPYGLEWTKNTFHESSNHFQWALAYTAGANSTAPATIEILLDCNNASPTAWQQIFLKDTFQLKCGDTVVDLAETTNYTVTTAADGRTVLSLTIPAQYKDKDFSLLFETTRTDGVFQAGNAVTVYNYACFGYGGETGPDVHDTASANAGAVKWIEKNDVQSGTSINWTITINVYDRNLETLDLYDQYDGTKLHPPRDLVVTGDGNTLTNPTFTKVTTTDDTYKLNLISTYPAYSEYVVKYTTDIDRSVFDNGTADKETAANKAWLDFTWKSYGSGDTSIEHTPPEITKDASVIRNLLGSKTGSYNPVDRSITWTVTVNPYAVNVTGGTLTDTLPKGLTFDSLVTNGGGKVSVSGCVSDADGVQTLTFTLGNIGAGKITFSFKTLLSESEKGHYAYNGNAKVYPNTISLTAYIGGDNSSGITTTASGSATVSGQVVVKAALANSYNYTNHQLTWTVTLNQKGIPMPNAVLTDTLMEGLAYLDGSVILSGAALSGEVTYDAASRLLTIPLKPSEGNDRIKQNATVTFVTVVDPDSIPAFKENRDVTITNTVKLNRESYPTEGTLTSADGTVTNLGSGSSPLYTASATKVVANKTLTKTGKLVESNTRIDYSVNVNMNGLTLHDLSLEDKLPGGTRLDQTTVKLYRAQVNTSSGAITKDPAYASAPVAAPFTYDPAQNLLTLPLTAPSEQSDCRIFVLEYSVDIVDFKGGNYVNSITLFGKTGPVTEKPIPLTPAQVDGAVTAMRKVRGGIRLTLTDRVSGKPVGGVTFSLYTADGKTKLDEATTDQNGKLAFVALKLAEYLLVPGSVPEGYKPVVYRPGAQDPFDDRPTVSRPIKDGYTEIAAELDRPTVSLSFTKVSALGSTPLSGAKFTLVSSEQKKNGTPIYSSGTVSTGADGTLTLDGIYSLLDDHKYTLTETAAPAGHTAVTLTGKPNTSGVFVFDENPALTVSAGGGTVVTDSVPTDKGTILVHKTNSLTGAPISGITFELYDGATKLQSKTTDGGGVVLFSELDLNKTYTVRELPHPDYRPSADRTVTLTGSHASERLSWENTPLPKAGSLTVFKYDATTENHRPMSGVAFTLWRDGGKVDEKTTDGNGRVEFGNLPLHVTYTVTETTPDGYRPAPSRDFTLSNESEGDESCLLEWPNTRYGTITVHKYDATGGGGADMPGVTFTLSLDGEAVQTQTTLADGRATFTGLDLNKPYTLSEAVPEGYQPAADRTVTLTGESHSLAIEWPNLRKGEITVYKYDSLFLSPMPNVTFTLFLDGVPVASQATGADGCVTFTALTPGLVYLVRETVPLGYLPSGDRTVLLTDENHSVTLDWPNTRNSGGGGVTPTPPPEPPPSPSPEVTPTPPPEASPSPSPEVTPTPPPDAPPSPAPTGGPAPVPPSAPAEDPYIRPDLPTDKKDEVLDIVDEAHSNPDIVIRDLGTLQDEYPTLDIEDLPIPLYWAPDIAVLETPEEELVVIDSALVPLGFLPQTGMAGLGADMTALLLPACLAAAAGLCLALGGLLRKRRG